MAIYCSKCGVSLPDGVAFCDACGTPVRGQDTAYPATSQPPAALSGAGSVACPVCGASALPGEAFCDNCGAALLPASVPAALTQAPQAPQTVPQYQPAQVEAYPQYGHEPQARTASLVV